MKRVLIWGSGVDYDKNMLLLQYYQSMNEFTIVGIVSLDCYYTFIDRIPYYTKEEIKNIEFDYLIICATNAFFEIQSEAEQLGIADNRILSVSALTIPGFRLERYMQLKNSHISIIANNCWGGLTYHYLSLQFDSPFINMFIEDGDYINILKNLDGLKEKPVLIGTEYNKTLDITYPVYELNGSKLYMNHYSDFKLAEKKWNERKERINWNNLFIMMHTESKSCAKAFEELPYEKKVCFVPFETDLASSFYLPCRGNVTEPFFSIVNKCAQGIYKGYDIWDLLDGSPHASDRVCMKIEGK